MSPLTSQAMSLYSRKSMALLLLLLMDKTLKMTLRSRSLV